MNFLLVIHVVLLTYHSGPGEVVLWRWAYYRHAFPLRATHNISFCVIQPYPPPTEIPIFSIFWGYFSCFTFLLFPVASRISTFFWAFFFLFFRYLYVFLPIKSHFSSVSLQQSSRYIRMQCLTSKICTLKGPSPAPCQPSFFLFVPLLLPWPYIFLILPYFLYPCFRYSCNIFKSIEKTYGAFSRITFLHFHILACQRKAKLL